MGDSIPYNCHSFETKGIWFGGNPLESPVSSIMAQVILVVLTSRLLYYFLKPLGQTKVACSLLGGIIFGPSMIGHNKAFSHQFFGTKGQLPVFKTMATMGTIYSIFLIALKFDPVLIKRTAKSSWKIGVAGFLLPSIVLLYPVTQVRSFIVPNLVTLLICIISWSFSFFPVIAEALYELNLMTSELGQLAMSSAMLNDALLWFLIILHLVTSTSGFWVIFLSILGLLLFTLYILRPLMLLIVKKTLEGEAVKEIYVVAILVGVLVMSFITDFIGLRYTVGPMILGLVIPDGPPLGATLTAKTELLVSELLLPVFFFGVGSGRVNVFSIDDWTIFAKRQIIILVLYFSKIVGVTVAGLLCKISFKNSLVLGMIMSMKGIVEVMIYSRWRTIKMIDDQFFTQLVLSALALTMMVTPVVRFSYAHTPHTRLRGSAKDSLQVRNIQSLPKNSGMFRVLCCVHNEESAHSIITLLESSNPTEASPICAYIVHAVDLIGRSAPRLTPHKSEEKKLGRLDSPTHQMMRAFENYSDNSRGPAIIHAYTMVAPYKSMHETIFRLAQDKLVSLIIIPFHENRQSMVGTDSTGAIRQLNLHLQEFSPCTVGILVDRGLPCRPSVSYFSYVVALFFIGGPDDREALAYTSRLADNTDVGITVFRIIVMRTNKTEVDDDVETEFKLDESLLNEFKLRNTRNDRLDWHDIEADDGVGVVSAIMNSQGQYDLVMVGRRHFDVSLREEEMTGLLNNPELGVIGDMLASSDFCDGMANVLVMQESRSLSCRAFLTVPHVLVI
ncbi:hypothetical protein M0R45_037598 [Rubus argutus]|uniref:Cation/H+ exchanger domain-containing protein n=1 Tax=Rubus argutus TaxID=59490 RepID=A0AAW1W3A5_RUBAR